MDEEQATNLRAAVAQAMLSYGQPSASRAASEVFPRIYISDLYTARRQQTLQDLSITHVITALERPVNFPLEVPLTTLRIPLADSFDADLSSHIPSAVDFITLALQDPDARVLVHCFQGVSRSPSLVAAYLIASQSMGADEAIGLLKSTRPIVRPNPGFIDQLRKYEAISRVKQEGA